MPGYSETAVQAAGFDESTTNQVFYSNNKLQPEILTSIFRHFESEIQLLLNCRLVCKHWKSVVDTPELIRNLTFNIRSNDDWHLFKESTIVSKVQSLRISQPITNIDKFEEEFGDISQFADQIGESVEKIVFDFDAVRRNFIFYVNAVKYYELAACEAAKLALILVTASANLKELHILKAPVVSILAESWSSERLELPENLKKLVLVGGAESVKKIICRFPKLTRIDISNSENTLAEDIKIYSALYEYVTLINDGSLKEIILNWNRNQYTHEWFKFLFTVLNRGIVLKMDFLHLWDGAQDLLTYKETDEAPINESTCKEFIMAYLLLKELPFPTGRIGYCKNIKSLRIDFARPAATAVAGITEELAFLQKLQKLEELYLAKAVMNHLEVTFCPRNVLAYGFPLLQKFRLEGDLFGPILDTEEVFSSFYHFFPNLKYLYLYDIQIVPENLFLYLSKLELLEKMQLHNCKLTDGIFTKPDENTNFLPAINAFRLLRKLVIEDCTEMTDESVIDAIALSGTLVEVSIFNFHQQFTTVGQQAFSNAGFEYYELVDSLNFIRTQQSNVSCETCFIVTLPENLLGAIFQWDKVEIVPTLLNCRLVSKKWKSAVDNSPKLMRMLTFNITEHNWEEFSKSAIASKVTSIRVKVWGAEEDTNLKSWKVACYNVEKIIFDFKDQDLESLDKYAEIITTLLSIHRQLNELHFLNPAVVSKLPKILSNSRKEVWKIEFVKSLFIVTTAKALKAIIISYFPRLVAIRIQKCGGEEDREIYDILCEYVKRKNNTLKEIELDWQFEQDSFEWFRFLIVLSTRNVQINSPNQKIFEKAASQYLDSAVHLTNNKMKRIWSSCAGILIHSDKMTAAALMLHKKKNKNLITKKIRKALVFPLSLI